VKAVSVIDTFAGIQINHVPVMNGLDVDSMQLPCPDLQEYLVQTLEPTATKAVTVQLKLHFIREHMTWQI
jgi:hypothetical protein